MRGERRLLRVGEYLIGCASRLLPGEMREERCREWTAELPAILRDPDTSLAARRAARMLRYAAGTVWVTARAPGNARGQLTVVMAAVGGLFTVSILTLVVTSTMSAVRTPGNWVPYSWIATSCFSLSWLGRSLARRIRRADRPMEAVRDAVVDYGAWLTPDWLLSRLLRAVGANESDLLGKTGAACSPPAPRRAAPAASAQQAISLARDAVARFYRVRLRPGYQTADVDDFIARIEATLTTGGQPGRAVTAADVQAAKFGTTWRGGYDEMVVDEALDHYADGLARLAPSPDPNDRPLAPRE
jgi:DivIVA domain-containing protein